MLQTSNVRAYKTLELCKALVLNSKFIILKTPTSEVLNFGRNKQKKSLQVYRTLQMKLYKKHWNLELYTFYKSLELGNPFEIFNFRAQSYKFVELYITPPIKSLNLQNFKLDLQNNFQRVFSALLKLRAPKFRILFKRTL